MEQDKQTEIEGATGASSAESAVLTGGLGVNLSVIFSYNQRKRHEILDKISLIGRLQRQIDKEKTELTAMINKFMLNVE